MSRLIKSQWPDSASDKKVISIKLFNMPEVNENFTEKEPESIDAKPIIEEVLREADWIRSQAKSDSEALMAQVQEERVAWETEKVLLVNQAREEGYHDGWTQGQSEGYSAYEEKLQHAEQIIRSAKKDYLSYLETSKKAILDIAVSIARKIVDKQIEDNQEYFVSLVKKAVREVKEFLDVEIHVHPNNYEYLSAKKEELLVMFPHTVNLIIYPDSELSEGSCLLESPYGRIDASIDTQLTEIKQKLTEWLESDSYENS